MDQPQASQPGARGASLGLPADGPGALAGFSTRVVAFFVDAIGSALIAGIFTAPALPGNWSLLVWAVLTVVPTAAFGMTPGMTLLGLRVARLGTATFVGLPRALLRTVLLFFVLPAVIVNGDVRGLHDRAAGTVVLRTR